MFQKKEIPRLQEKISALQKRVFELEGRARALVTHGRANFDRIPTYFADQLALNERQTTDILAYQSLQEFVRWQPDLWQEWEPPIVQLRADGQQSGTPRWLRIGDLLEVRNASEYKVPAMIPFVGQYRTIVVRSQGDDQSQVAIQLLQSLVARTALMLPHQTTYTLVDPAHNGASFPMRRHLPHVRENSGDARRDLELVVQDIQRIIENYIDASYPSFELVNPEIRLNERFQFVFAADFPQRYDRRMIELLQNIGTTGPRAGTYLFIQHNLDNALPRDISMDDFRNAYVIDLTKPSVMVQGMGLKLDAAPDPQLQNHLFDILNRTKPQERKIDFMDIVGNLPEEEWWTRKADEIIVTPIGVRGASGELNLWFGENHDGQPCAHGMLGAMTGAGKSNLYHVFILGLALRYSPDEVRFFLIDGKDGVEFQQYRKLPHAEVVSLKSSPQLSRSVLTELVAERERRNKIFTEVGVTDIKKYREIGQPQGKLPRILLLVDEYQELFEGDTDGLASNLLLQIAQQGRSAGIHILLGSQRFGAVGMLNQTAIFGNVHLRLAMQMTNSDVQALTEFGRRGKQLIASCDLPGKIVVNDRSGDDDANEIGKVAFLRDEKRTELIEKLDLKSKDLPSKDVPVTIVFDGQAQPNLIENQYVEYLLHQDSWLSTDDMQTLARRPIHDEGLNVTDWFSAEHPKVMWLGQEFSVRGQSMMVFRRRPAEHAIVIGANDAVRYGILGSLLVGLALNSPPENLEFMIMDRSIPGTAWSNILYETTNLVLKPAGYSCTFYRDNRDAETMLDKLIQEMKRRRELTETELMDEPSLFVLMTELDRIDNLRRRADSYGMSASLLGDKLQTVFIEGASLGIHLILSFGGVRLMTHVIDERAGLVHFRHRVTLQIAEDESLTFVRSRKAAQLQMDGKVPVVGLYMDVDGDKSTRFKPYTIESTIPYLEQMRQIGQRIMEWRNSS